MTKFNETVQQLGGHKLSEAHKWCPRPTPPRSLTTSQRTASLCMHALCLQVPPR